MPPVLLASVGMVDPPVPVALCSTAGAYGGGMPADVQSVAIRARLTRAATTLRRLSPSLPAEVALAVPAFVLALPRLRGTHAPSPEDIADGVRLAVAVALAVPDQRQVELLWLRSCGLSRPKVGKLLGVCVTTVLKHERGALLAFGVLAVGAR